MSKRKRELSIAELWVKTIIYGLILLLILILFSLAPKEVLDEDASYELATSMSIIEDDNLLLYDYKVFGTENRFNQGLVDDVNEVKADFKERNEILAVMVYGQRETFVFKDDYIYITNPQTPELNIEFYLVKDLEINEVNLPARTFIKLYDDVSQAANNIYFALLLIVSFSFFTPFGLKFTRLVIKIRKHSVDMKG